LKPDRELRAGVSHAGEAPKAVDLTSESAATKQLYGMDENHHGIRPHVPPVPKAVERGVRFVQLYSGAGSKWDAHSDIEGNHSKLCRATTNRLPTVEGS